MTKQFKNKDNIYLDIAEKISILSGCTRSRIGCIIVKNDIIVSYGFNGGIKNNCTYESCYRTKKQSNNSENESFCIGNHAELRALRTNKDLLGATCYCNMLPCNMCARNLIDAGITKIVYNMDYQDETNNSILNKYNIELVQIKENISPDEIIKQLAKLDQPEQEYINNNLQQLLKQRKFNYEK